MYIHVYNNNIVTLKNAIHVIHTINNQSIIHESYIISTMHMFNDFIFLQIMVCLLFESKRSAIAASEAVLTAVAKIKR